MYEPIEVERFAGDALQCRSNVLDLDIRWHDSQLEWFYPETGRHIMTLDDERAARIHAKTHAAAAEAQACEREEELRRLRGK